ncbi:MAG: DUF624 domain-containing protein [Clostridiaceae bacterium]|uniref:DUF624 domain-containing protein n=1 Tax=Thermoclostridium caenicola TaxID=659425 RepID=UPI002C3B724A|nr:DUF624 domain-containing protein [Thermoclostridium caenicola]NLU32515.1 DUF624 domain-containing protein [Clostridiaceae bacterium]HPO76465.1 DUF624 domain-containing protein [Thermoclostridium caenicola]
MTDEPIFEKLPGEKYEDNRSRLAIFFGVLYRKFWRLITINLMFIVFNIPAIVLSYFLSIYLIGIFIPEASTISIEEFRFLLWDSGFPTTMFFMAIPIITVGPAQAGLTYLLRCYSYERPTFTWSDFRDKMKENFKQGIAVTFINLFLLLFLIFDLYLYPRVSDGGVLFSIANGLMIMVFILFMMASLYIYPMMVTYELKIRDLYKNAVLFALARFLPNLVILILCFLVIIGPTLILAATGSGIVLLITYLIYVCFGFTLPGLIINFMVNPVMDKYLNRNRQAQ